MTHVDTTAPSQSEAVSLEFELRHSPQKIWRALTDPVLLAEWLLPVVNLKLEPGAAFMFQTQPHPGWDGTVNCRVMEVDAHRKLSYAWNVPGIETVVTFTLSPTSSGTRLSVVQSGFKQDQKQNFAGARYGWRMMAAKFEDVLAKIP